MAIEAKALWKTAGNCDNRYGIAVNRTRRETRWGNHRGREKQEIIINNEK